MERAIFTEVRAEQELYPDFTAELDAVRKEGISAALLQKIIHKHKYNAAHNKKLYDRYKAILEGLPIFGRTPRFTDEVDAINNKINNDFFGEIVDFKTGYFAGTAAKYGYAHTEEAENELQSTDYDTAAKLISDFVTRSNMRDVNMEVTKGASIYGYSGRLMFIDTDGNERAMFVPGFQVIVLSSTSISEPEYAIRYFCTKDINGNKIWHAEFYDEQNIYYYKGALSNLSEDTTRRGGAVQMHLFDYCPLQAIPNNGELLGDAEKVIPLIDDYDKNVSDNSNEIEGFVHALMVLENVNASDEVLERAQHTGALSVHSNPNKPASVYYLTKDVNDNFTEHHMERLKDNIYRFSKTPNMTDESFGAASGVSLKFKLHGLDTKCDMFESKFQTADTYMFKVLASSWAKRGYNVDYLQCTVEYTRSFPLDELQEAQTAQTRLAAGLPKHWVYAKMASVDDADYIMKLIEDEKDDIEPLDTDWNFGSGEAADEQ